MADLSVICPQHAKKSADTILIKTLVVFILLCMSLMSFAQIGHWSLNNNANDVSGTGIDGTLKNSPTFSTDKKEGTHALVLNGTNQYVDLGNPTQLPSGTAARTISAWAKTSVTTGSGVIFAYGSPSTTQAFYLGMNGTSLVGGAFGNSLTESGFWTADTWQHVCMTYDGSTVRLYAGGVEVNSATRTWSVALQRAYIGRHVNNNNYWNGSIDDVRIYNSALSASEVAALAATGPQPPEAPGNLAVTTTSTTEINLTWADIASDETGFEIERSLTSESGFTLIHTTASNEVTYTDTGLAEGTEYFYRIRAVSGTLASPYTSEVSSITLSSVAAPNGLAAQPISTSALNLTWADNSANETGFEIERSLTPETDYALIFSTGANITTYTDNNLSPGTTYYYRIRAITGSSQSSYSSEFNATTQVSVSGDLVGHWRLNNNVEDASGNDLDGIVLNNPSFTSDNIEGSHALTFNGTDQAVDLGNPSQFPSGSSSRSISAWAKTNTESGDHMIFTYGSAANSQAMFIGQQGTNLYVGGFGGSNNLTVSNFWSPGIWHHICLTYDGTTARLYADGEQIDFANKSWDLVLYRAFIGKHINNIGFWDGTIDDVRLYSKELSVAEILVLANKVPIAPSSLAATASSSSVINLTWTDNSTNETGFEIERSLTPGNGFETIAIVGPNVSSFTDTGLANGMTYYYRIKAKIDDQESAYTSEVPVNITPPIGEGLVWDHEEFQILKDIYDALAGNNWTNKTNWPSAGNWPSSATSAEFATWHGITATNGDITAINLIQNNLTGQLPSSISGLRMMTDFDVRINKINGAFPAFLTSMTQLTNLGLYSNQISGQIPSDIGSLVNLEVLRLSGNLLTGSIPESIGNLKKLRWISLYNNAGLTGPLPSTFYDLTNLTDLYIYNTQISGPLLPAIGKLTKLINFWGYNNKWSEDLPAELGDIVSLENLYLHNNNFTGPLPENWTKLKNLKNLYLHYNPITGELPAWVGNLASMEILSIGWTDMTGILPGSYGSLSNLTELYLGELDLEGEIPGELENLNNLTLITLDQCNLEGSIPDWLMNKTTIKSFYLNNNKFLALPDFSSRTDKSTLTIHIQNNQISVEEIERYFTAPATHPFGEFAYGPQTNTKITEAISFSANSTFRIEAPSGGAHGVYLWERLVNGSWNSINDLNTSAIPNEFVINNATEDLAGTYRYKVTNSWMPDILFESGSIEITITDAPIETINPLYNGLITAMRWRTDKAYGTTEEAYEGMYVFDYDDKYQIKDASWADYTSNSYSLEGNKYRLTGMTYDPNGNIKTLRRYKENGGFLHNFTYHYFNEDPTPVYNNRLKSVDGYTNVYSYNAVGQMIGEDKVEEGKDQYVEYDVAGKVIKVYSEETKTAASLKIENIYDDRGFRLAKINYETQRTTWYIRDASGNVISIYEQEGTTGAANQNNITLTEVPVYGAGKLGTVYPQDDGSMNYEITDHLGNVRALLRDNVNIYTATMEDNGVESEENPFENPRVEEMQYFDNLFETEVEDAFMNVTPPTSRELNPDKVAYLHWNDNAGTQAADKAVGPSIALKVNAGDKITLEAWTRYEDKLTYTRDLDLIAVSALLGNTFVSQVGFEGATPIETGNTLLGGLTGAGYGSEDDNTAPHAYLNYIIYDENMVYQHADWERVPETAASDQSELYIPENKPVKFGFNEPVVINQSGYIYIWLSNESKDTRVWFDDLTVTHTQNLVVQASDYGVWGDVLREQKSDERKYRVGYQGQFAEKDEETGWNHFELREYDPVIGRWLIPDPYRQHWSTYLAMGNNPVKLVDPDGGCDDCTGNPGDITNIAGKDYIWNGDNWVPMLETVTVTAAAPTFRESFETFNFNPAPIDNVRYNIYKGPKPLPAESKRAGILISSEEGTGAIDPTDGTAVDGYNIKNYNGLNIPGLQQTAELFGKFLGGFFKKDVTIKPKPPETRDSTVHGPLIRSYRLDEGGPYSSTRKESINYTIDVSTNKTIKTDTTIIFGK